MAGTPNGTVTNLATALGPTLTWVSSNTDINNDLTWDAGNFSPASDGLLIILAFGNFGTPADYSSITVGGNAATIWFVNGSGGHRYAIAGKTVTAGTYDITITNGSVSATNQAVGVWLLTNYNVSSPTSINWADAASTTEPMTYDRTVGGVFVGAALINITTALTWSSATERLDVNLESNRYTMADITTPFTSTTQATETVTWTGTSITSTHLCAVFV